jgi:Ca-activated chloride channel family protein
MKRVGAACGVMLCSLFCAAAAGAETPITVEARLAQAVMKSGEAQKTLLRVGLQGCKLENTAQRPPVNVAFVIDRSGSMEGHRIAQAREAAVMAVNRLTGSDIASVVIFDDRIEVLVPAQPVSDPAYFAGLIRQVGVRGRTAIYDGVLEGARQVSKFKDAKRLNRVILLSDGLANVGPSRPEDFAQLGRQLLADGISVSTVGLGLDYNEDLLLKLARAADGNHAFAREPSDLIQIFNKEFDDVLSSCAQMVSVDVELKAGVRAVRALSREGTIDGQRAQFRLNQVYAATEHYVLLELELDKNTAKGEADLGVVKVAYTPPEGGDRQVLETPIKARFSSSEEEVKASLDPKVAEAAVEQLTRERTEHAIALRDQGKFEEARQLFAQNAADIEALLAKATTSSSSARLNELKSQYYALGATFAPAAPARLGAERKLLRQLDVTTAGAAVRY